MNNNDADIPQNKVYSSLESNKKETLGKDINIVADRQFFSMPLPAAISAISDIVNIFRINTKNKV